MGNRHTAEFLAQMTAQAGDIKSAITILMKLRETESKHGAFYLYSYCSPMKNMPRQRLYFETSFVVFQKQRPYTNFSPRCESLLDSELKAMRVLEQALEATHCASGTCGYQPPDPEVKRLLAILYLEDNIELQRATELIAELPVPKQPLWDDVYLKRSKAVPAMARPIRLQTLLANTPEDHPAHSRATQYLLGG